MFCPFKFHQPMNKACGGKYFIRSFSGTISICIFSWISSIKCIQSLVEDIETTLRPLTGKELQEIEPEDPMDRAKMHFVLAKTYVSMLRLLLQCKGVDHKEDKNFDRECERIKIFERKVGKAMTQQELHGTEISTERNLAHLNQACSTMSPVTDQKVHQRKNKSKSRKRKGSRTPNDMEEISIWDTTEEKPSKVRGNRDKSSRDAALSFLNSLDIHKK